MGGWRRRWPRPVGALALVLALAAGPGLLPVALRQVGELDGEGVNLLLVFPLLKARPRCVRRVELWLRVLATTPSSTPSSAPSSRGRRWWWTAARDC